MSIVKYILFSARSSVEILTTSQKVKVGKKLAAAWGPIPFRFGLAAFTLEALLKH
jgi:hypothetical protein